MYFHCSLLLIVIFVEMTDTLAIVIVSLYYARMHLIIMNICIT